MQGILLLVPKMDTIAIYSNGIDIYLPSSHHGKGWYTMNTERQLIVNLEVTVPSLILPIPSLDLDATSAEAEQVRLSSTDTRETTARAQAGQQPASVGEVTTSATYGAQQEPFRLFAIKHIQTHGQALLLQILRHWKRRNQARGATATQSAHLTDELLFTVEVRQSKTPAEGTRRTPYPGRNQVIIFLDEEGIPNSYSIDGAER
jgi:hypothetical protein